MVSESRTLRAFRAIVRALTERTDYHALVRYRVVKNTAGRVELQAVKKAGPWPDTLPVSLQPGAPGVKGVPKLAAVVLVSFVEGDPSLPVVSHFARTDDPAWLPISVALDASTLVRVGEHAASTELGSGDQAFTGTNQAKVVVRWGDTYVDPVSGPVVLTPGPATNIAKVKA